MTRRTTIGITALLALGFCVPVWLWLSTPSDPHYGALPKIISGALGLLLAAPACVWACVANWSSPGGKAAAATLAATVALFLYLNYGLGGFGGKCVSFLVLAGGLLLSTLLTMALLVRGWRKPAAPAGERLGI